MSPVSRRDFLSRALLLPAVLRPAFAPRATAGKQVLDAARLVGTVPFLGSPPPLDRLVGAGLDARLFTDLSSLSADALITPNERFYIRTAEPPPPRPASVTEIGGVDLSGIEPVRVGPFVMECAGNSDPTNFGLLSAATWTGYPLPAVLDRLSGDRTRRRVLVAGADPSGPSVTSIPGAAWIFTRDQLDRAILAVQMNGAPLPADHGAPMRLLVPGWYGCACIKWVNQIELVTDEAAATTQMREFAQRTHQTFDPADPAGALRARDYTPAIIDTAAMPVRVEKWVADGRPFYRVVGIVWGGSKPTNALSIRFKSGGLWNRVDHCPLPASTLTWSLWSHTWRPTEPGRYEIVLRVDDPSIRTRRLDLFFYVRQVVIEEF